MKNLTKKDLVVIHLLRHKNISGLEALNLYQTYRLATVIYSLRNQGAVIQTVNEQHRDGFHARYFLVDDHSLFSIINQNTKIALNTVFKRS